MSIKEDEELLDEFRGPGKCEWCGHFCHKREPHHLWARGRSDAFRMDIRINLIALGGAADCNCHGKVHAGNGILRDDLLAVVAQREGCLQDDIRMEILKLRRSA